jgi:hypothetical protein
MTKVIILSALSLFAVTLTKKLPFPDPEVISKLSVVKVIQCIVVSSFSTVQFVLEKTKIRVVIAVSGKKILSLLRANSGLNSYDGSQPIKAKNVMIKGIIVTVKPRAILFVFIILNFIVLDIHH